MKNSRYIFGEERKEVIERGMEWITMSKDTESTCEEAAEPEDGEDPEDFVKRKNVYDIPESEKGKSLEWCKDKCVEMRCRFIFHSDTKMKCHVMNTLQCDEEDQTHRQDYVGDNYQLKSEGFYTLNRKGDKEEKHKKKKFDDKKRKEIAVEQIKKVAKQEDVQLVIVVFHGNWMGKLTDFETNNWLDGTTCPHRSQAMGAKLSPPTGSVRFLEVNSKGNGWVCDGERFMITPQTKDEVQDLLKENPIWSGDSDLKVPTKKLPMLVQLGGPDYYRIRKAKKLDDCTGQSVYYARGASARKSGGELLYVGAYGGAMKMTWRRKPRNCILDFGDCDDGSDKKKKRGCLITGYIGKFEDCVGGGMDKDHSVVGGPSIPSFKAGLMQFLKIAKGHFSCFHKGSTCKYFHIYTHSWLTSSRGVEDAGLVEKLKTEYMKPEVCPEMKDVKLKKTSKEQKKTVQEKVGTQLTAEISTSAICAIALFIITILGLVYYRSTKPTQLEYVFLDDEKDIARL